MMREEQRITLSEGHGTGQMDRLGDLWCTFMHASPMWPIHGQYECGTCGRRHPVPWEEQSNGASNAGHQIH